MNYLQLLDVLAHNDVILGIEREKYRIPKIKNMLELLNKTIVTLIEQKEQLQENLDLLEGELESQVEEYDEEIDELKEEHKKEINELKKTYENQISNLKDDLKKLNDEYRKLENKRNL